MGEHVDRGSDRILDELQEMGLTYQESLVYSELVAMGPSHARKVSEQAKLPREDCYRILKRLESKGLVEILLDRPSVFVAVEPRTAVRSFVSKLEARSQELKQKAYDIGVRLEEIKGTARCYEVDLHSSVSPVRVLSGHHAFADLERSLRSCHSEYVGVLHPTIFVTSSGAEVLEGLTAANKRGVHVRILTEFTPENFRSIQRYSKQLAIRHHSGMSQGIRFSVIDGCKTVLALTEPVANPDGARVMCSSTSALARGLKFYFEQMWRESETEVELRSGGPAKLVGIR